jgi:hypothetical protein
VELAAKLLGMIPKEGADKANEEDAPVAPISIVINPPTQA